MNTIVYFTSDTCKPCKFLLPKVTELMKDDPELKLVIVPIDTRGGALKAQQAGVMTVPTLLFPEDDEIDDMTARLLPSMATIKNIKKALYSDQR